MVQFGRHWREAGSNHEERRLASGMAARLEAGMLACVVDSGLILQNLPCCPILPSTPCPQDSFCLGRQVTGATTSFPMERRQLMASFHSPSPQPEQGPGDRYLPQAKGCSAPNPRAPDGPQACTVCRGRP